MLTKHNLSLLLLCLTLLFRCSTKDTVSSTPENLQLYPIKENSRWGYMDQSGKIVVAPTYDYAWDFSEGLGRFKEKGKYGFINVKGEVVIQPSFAYADDFKGEYTRVNTKDTTIASALFDGYGLESHWTFVNKSGVVFSQTFAVAEPVKANVSAVKDVNNYEVQYSYVTFSNGELIRNERITEAVFTFNNSDLAPASDPTTGKIGMIDKNEEWIIFPSFDQVEPMSEGLAAAKKDNLFGYIDAKGNWVYQQVVSPNDYFYLSSDFKPFSNGLAAVRLNRNQYIYITKAGKDAFKQRFKSAGSFTKDGYAIVSTESGTGLIDTKGTFVIKPNLEIESVDRGVVIYRSTEGYGAKDLKTLKDIVPPKHSEVVLTGNLIRFREVGPTAGYINENGEFVISPQFDAAWEFKNGKGIVNLKDKIVYIDKGGKVLEEVPPTETPFYDANSAFIYAWSDESGKYGYSSSGNQMATIPPTYDFATDFEGKVGRVNIGAALNEEAYAYQGGKWGLIDEEANTILQPSYELIMPFKNHIAAFNTGGDAQYTLCEGECSEYVYYTCSGGKWGLLNDNGKVTVEPKYDRIIPFGKNFLVLEEESYMLIDATGKELMPKRFDLTEYIEEGAVFAWHESNFTEVVDNGKTGIIDTDGNWIVPAQFDKLRFSSLSITTPFSEGLILVKSGDVWGAADASGNVVVTPAFEDMAMFSGGMAAVFQNGKWGFVDKSGALVIEPKFHSVRDFQGDVAIVKLEENGLESVINKKGEVVYQARAGVTLSLEGFKEGLCIIRGSESSEEAGYPSSTCGVINSKGKVLFNQNALTDARIQAGGLLYVIKNAKWAVATADGAMLTAFDYDWIEPYEKQKLIRCNIGGEATYDELDGSEGFYGGLWGLLNTKGKLQVPVQFAEIGSFSDGLAPARSKDDLDKVGYADFEGKVIRQSTR